MINTPSTDISVSPQPCMVSDFVRQIRRHLEGGIPLGWVRGEVSNLTRASSGHIYFTIKDADAQLRCAMWRNRAQLLAFQLREGMEIEVRAQVTVYEPRGDLQLSVESIRQAGLGNLFEAFMRLKAKLEAEGLFEAARKRALPRLPRRIAIVTSPQAAALQDVLTTLKRRAPGLQIVLYPTRVQGEGAGEQIAAAIRSASDRRLEDGCEALILCRGGGSLEDLWAFNEESVVRAVCACPLPVISGVGHETDVTLADFAADLRAATPTAAAEQISAGLFVLRERLGGTQAALNLAATRRLQALAQRVDVLDHRLRHPREQLSGSRSQLAALDMQLTHAYVQRRHRVVRRLDDLGARLLRHAPDSSAQRAHLWQLAQRLTHALQLTQQNRTQTLTQLASALEHLDPAQIMLRGYSIVRDADGKLVRHAHDLRQGSPVSLQFATGSAQAEITRIDTDRD